MLFMPLATRPLRSGKPKLGVLTAWVARVTTKRVELANGATLIAAAYCPFAVKTNPPGVPVTPIVPPAVGFNVRGSSSRIWFGRLTYTKPFGPTATAVASEENARLAEAEFVARLKAVSWLDPELVLPSA